MMSAPVAEISPSKGRQKTAATPDVYRYVPINQFTPLVNTDWQALNKVVGGNADANNPWRFWLEVLPVDRGTKAQGQTPLKVVVDLVSYKQNVFRIRFDPAAGTAGQYKPKMFGPVTQANLDAIRNEEISGGAPKTGVFQFSGNTLKFKTANLTVAIDASYKLTVTFNGQVIHSDAVDSNGYGLGATFVSTGVGHAVATVKKNSKGSQSVRERFYGQGEVNVTSGKSVEQGGYYVLGKTGLSMTNFNYDQISYQHPELAPSGYPGLDPNYPDYYYPMYFSAPWLIALGNAGKSNQYAYGVYLDNPSQTYTNTGDTFFGPGVGAADKFYLGAQYGELDTYFVFGPAYLPTTQAVQNVVQGLSYITRNSTAPHFQRAILPPKYIFGYFQGVYGASGINAAAYPPTDPTIENAVYFDEIYNGYKNIDVPLEGFAVDIDVQDIYKVFTTNSRFWLNGKIGGTSIFDWAHGNGMVTQTNITCFIRDTDPNYSVFTGIVSGKHYTTNAGAGGVVFNNDGHGPKDAYCGQLQYGQYSKTTAIFPDWGKTGTAEWWGKNYPTLFDIGLDFVWQDMTTPSADTHIIGNKVVDDTFDLSTLQTANSANPGQAAQYAETFNWRSYHMQVELTDPRFGDQAQRSFAETRNQHAYSLCSATYTQGIQQTAASRKKFKRSYIIARGGQIGSHQFGGLWMGDNSSDWQHLNLMVPMVISMNMSGVSVVGADIGGFAQADSAYDPSKNEGNPPSPELLTRWVQAGFLLPWFRNHYDRWISLDPSTAENPADWKPKNHGKPYQEIYNAAYAAKASSTKTYQQVMREAIQMRYRWQEVFYTAAYNYATLGIPLIKPMCMWNNDPNIDFDARPELNSQFLLGPSSGYEILAAPIVTQSQTSRSAYFPGNVNWMPFGPADDDSDVHGYYAGGTDRTISADITTTPAFVAQGAILPTRYTQNGAAKPLNTYTESDPLVFDVFSALQSKLGQIYLDDSGASTDAEDKGAFGIMRVASTTVDKTSATLVMEYDPNRRAYLWSESPYIRLRAVGKVTGVTVNGQALKPVAVTDKYHFFASSASVPTAFWIDTGSGSVWVRAPKLSSASAKNTVVITCSDTINRATAL